MTLTLDLTDLEDADFGFQLPGKKLLSTTPPVFLSWADYLAQTSAAERMTKCRRIAATANRKGALSKAPKQRLTAQDVWAIIEAAKGRCAYCGSLAVENRPSRPTGGPLSWAQVGRRIGSLDHRKPRGEGGTNKLSNLAWACLWCNTYEEERQPLSPYYGGYYPDQ